MADLRRRTALGDARAVVEGAVTAYAFAVARYPAKGIVLWGESLGSGLALATAGEKPVGGVVLEAPFSSAADVGAQHYWFVPVRLFMKDQFRSICAPARLRRGCWWRTARTTLSFRLRSTSGCMAAPNRFVRVAGVGHNDLGAHGVAAAKQFIAEQ